MRGWQFEGDRAPRLRVRLKNPMGLPVDLPIENILKPRSLPNTGKLPGCGAIGVLGWLPHTIPELEQICASLRSTLGYPSWGLYGSFERKSIKIEHFRHYVVFKLLEGNNAIVSSLLI